MVNTSPLKDTIISSDDIWWQAMLEMENKKDWRAWIKGSAHTQCNNSDTVNVKIHVIMSQQCLASFIKHSNWQLPSQPNKYLLIKKNLYKGDIWNSQRIIQNSYLFLNHILINDVFCFVSLPAKYENKNIMNLWCNKKE